MFSATGSPEGREIVSFFTSSGTDFVLLSNPVTQTFAQEIETGTADNQADTGVYYQAGIDVNAASGFIQHGAPFRCACNQTHPQKCKTGNRQTDSTFRKGSERIGKMKLNKLPIRGAQNNKLMALKDDLKKLHEIAHSGTPDAMEKYVALSDEITSKYTDQKDVDAIADFLINGYKEVSSEAEELNNYITLKQQIAPYTEIIPLGYIAKKYFGKSTAWLSQRINGSKVRGKVYTLSKKDLETFNFALQDISKQLGSLSIS